jgi:surfeit locus 1 family protein
VTADAPRSFRPGLVPTVAALLTVLGTAGLGTWQVQRHFWRQSDLAEKRAHLELAPIPLEQALADPDASAWRRVTVRGAYDHAQSIAVLRVRRGAEDGARILTPLRLADGRHILVDRGWAPYDHAKQIVDSPGEPGEVELTALLLRMALRAAPPGSAEKRQIEWLSFDPGRTRHPTALQAQLPYPIEPFLLQRESGDPGYPLGEITPPTSPVDHRQYAAFWYVVSGMALGTWIGFGFNQGREAAARAAVEGIGGR